MNQKDLIKYGLLVIGAYLIYKYVQDHGGIDGLLGTATVPATHPVGTTTTTTTGVATAPAPTIQAPVLDMTGLVVTPDINDSLSGTVKISGVPVRLSIITGDGRIFDTSGQDVTASLQGRGVDIVALRTAFSNAGAGMAGLAGGGGWDTTPPWMM